MYQGRNNNTFTTQTTKKPVFRLFVAGIPSGLPTAEIFSFFCLFGRFRIVDAGEESKNIESDINKHQSSSSQIATAKGKGHCILETENFADFQRLVEQKYIRFNGRTLTILKHRTGVGLIVQNKKLNRCRAILKRVPKGIKEEFLRERLETLAGKLQTLFKYMSENPLSNAQFSSRTDTYSVVFENREVAKKLITERKFKLTDKVTLLVEKYAKPSAAAMGKHYDRSLVASSPAIGTKTSYYSNLNNMDIEASKLGTLQHLQSGGALGDAFDISLANPKDCFDASSIREANTGNVYHYIKPTSKFYYQEAVRNMNPTRKTPNLSSKPTTISMGNADNYHFNLLASPLDY